MAPSQRPAGVFTLERPVGRGGMAQVWQARHPSGRPVAVKVLTAESATQPAFARAFVEEVRVAASLQHPAVVRVLDYGAGADGVDGAPWLAMELAEGGTLSGRVGRADWDEVLEVTRAVLAGLAHAHARGIVHRDLKPANVLLGPRPMLTDFGLAHLVGRGGLDERTARSGTPSCMAPEQFLGEVRDFGPWTDLYAVGCLVWKLLCGGGPFDTRGWARWARAHVQQTPPPLRPQVPVPDGLEDWLRTLLAKDPSERFPRAADAARALDAVASGASDRGSVAVPADWRRVEPPVPPTDLRDVGLGLFGLREGRLVDRADERDRLWRALRRAIQAGRPGACLLRGGPGSGKTRLALWLARRAHEVGVATVVRASPDPAREGVWDAALLARSLRLHDLSEAEALERLTRRYGASLALATDIAGMVGLGPAAPASAAVRHRVLRDALGLLTNRGGLVLVLDDLHGSPAAVEAAHALVSDPRAGAVLVVGTVRSDLLPTAPRATAALDALLASDDAEAVDVGSLPAEHRAAQVLELLPLAPSLLEATVDAAGGSPLLAAQLVSAWVARDALVPGDDGFALRRSEVLPDDVREVWSDRLDDLAPDEVRALGVLALLGPEASASEWWHACLAVGLPEPDVDRWLRSGLCVSVRRDRVRPCHGTLSELLVDRLGTDPEARRGAAEAVEANGRPGWAARAGRLYRSAGESDRAAPLLLRGARDARRLCALDEAERLLAETVDALDPIDGAQALRLETGLAQADVAIARTDFDAARDHLSRVEAAARRQGLARLLGEALAERARIAVALRDPDTGEPLYREALEHLADDQHRVLGWVHLGRALIRLQRMQEGAEAELHASLEAFRAAADPVGAARCEAALGDVLRARGDIEGAEARYRAALAAFERCGVRMQQAVCLSGLANLAVDRGDLDEAASCYERGGRLMAETGSAAEVFYRSNLGSIRVLQGDHGAARPLLDGALAGFEATGQAVSALQVRGIRLACFAAEGDWAGWDAEVDDIEAPLSRPETIELRITRCLEAAGGVARALGEEERAARVEALTGVQRALLAERG